MPAPRGPYRGMLGGPTVNKLAGGSGGTVGWDLTFPLAGLADELDRDVAELYRRLAQGLVIEAESTIAVSTPDVPVDTGALRSSGHVQEPKWTGEGVSVAFGYGSASVSYAAIVHETHKSKSKFLERHVLDRARKLGPNLEAHMAGSVRHTRTDRRS